MDIQTKKLQFIEEYLRLTNEEIVEKLANVLRKEKQKALKATAKPMSYEELADKLAKSEADIASGRVYSQQEVEAYFAKRRGR